MILSVSVSELRSNFSDYLDRVLKGTKIIIRDEKRNIAVAELSQTSNFDSKLYQTALAHAAGTLTDQNHPEWQTKEAVNTWLHQQRKSADRTF